MKKLVVFGLTSFFLGSCSKISEPIIPPLPDSEINQSLDSGPPCSPEQTQRLMTDFYNCGSCGNLCSAADADRCVNGFCRCGSEPACSSGADCRAGMCVLSDRHQECQTNADCNNSGTSGNQECLYNNLEETSYCVDVCEFDEECPTGFACIEGSCTFLTCVPEACDNIDNDCDGVVDENGDGSGPLSRWCYSGPDIMSVFPPCRKGVQFCQIGGMWSECEGEIPPRAEIGLLACDGIDNDCDLCADGTYVDGVCSPVEPNGFDIVYVIDISGSMSGTIDTVRAATESFSTIYSHDSNFRFGLVLVAGRGVLDRRAWVEHDLSNFEPFNTELASISANGGGDEPTWDSVYELATDEIEYGIDTDSDSLSDEIDTTRLSGISWRPGSIRIIVLFTDEEGQTYRGGRSLSRVGENEMCASMTNGESLFVFTQPGHFGDFDECATLFNLEVYTSEMISNLESIIVNPCL